MFHKNGLPKITTHPKLLPEHLSENGKLLSDEEFEQVKQHIAEQYQLPNHQAEQTLRVKIKTLFPNKKFCPSIIFYEKRVEGTDETEIEYYSVYTKKHDCALGEGSNGVVKLAQDCNTGELCVLKIMAPANLTQELFEKYKAVVEQEKQALIATQQHKATLFRENKRNKLQAEILMFFVSGEELFSIIVGHKVGDNWFEICSAVINAIANFHQLGLYHCDIKLENILYDFATKTANLVDLGFVLPHSYKLCIKRGTPGYIAPEILKGEGRYNEATEVYALGITLVDVLGLLDENKKEWIGKEYIFTMIDEADELYCQNYIIENEYVRKQVLGFLRKLTAHDPSDRPTLKQCQEFFSVLYIGNFKAQIIDLEEEFINELSECTDDPFDYIHKENKSTMISIPEHKLENVKVPKAFMAIHDTLTFFAESKNLLESVQVEALTEKLDNLKAKLDKKLSQDKTLTKAGLFYQKTYQLLDLGSDSRAKALNYLSSC